MGVCVIVDGCGRVGHSAPMMPDHSDHDPEFSRSRPSDAPQNVATRQDRSAAALRANLARRKQQTRARSTQHPGMAPASPAGSDPDGEFA
jgi:hypothetical protein